MLELIIDEGVRRRYLNPKDLLTVVLSYKDLATLVDELPIFSYNLDKDCLYLPLSEGQNITVISNSYILPYEKTKRLIWLTE